MFKIFNLLVISALLSNQVLACTDIRVIANDGAVVIARSMEFALDLKSNLRTRVQGHEFSPTLPNGKAGLNWTGKYGYLYLDGLGVDLSIEGMNEKGLAFEALYLPNIAQYQDPVAGQENVTIPYINIGDWALSNFATVDEVRKALPNILVIPVKLAQTQNQILPLHFSFHDSAGNSLVVEYVGGKLYMYDNEVGVMTNDPTFDWHVTNLNNYVNLKPTNPKPVVIKGMTFVATGQGNGMLGLPGDISPPSRFVKMAVFLAVVKPAADGPTAVNLAQHMINNVDIPFGLAREAGNANNYTSEYTQWTVFKDLKNKVFYYHTYDNLTLRKVEFSKLDFGAKSKPLQMPIDSTVDAVIDISDKFRHVVG